jgi:threonylcarbamoyladenosine tRNA methylthiotransferase MtaB
LLREIQRIHEAGFKEITLTGVHLGSYGRDLTPTSSLFELLTLIARSRAPELRFRVSSLEPMECTDAIVDVLAANDVFAPHVHLPLQHASDRILRAMRRPYTLAHYDRLVTRIRRLMPDASIGTDVIVGFPGESDEDVLVLRDFLADSPLTHVHVFPYSARPGTVASGLPHQVPGPAVRIRSRVIREVSRQLTERFRAGQVGSVQRALTIDDGTMTVTGNYLKVRIPPGRARNEWLQVQVTAGGEPLEGRVV